MLAEDGPRDVGSEAAAEHAQRRRDAGAPPHGAVTGRQRFDHRDELRGMQLGAAERSRQPQLEEPRFAQRRDERRRERAVAIDRRALASDERQHGLRGGEHQGSGGRPR